MQEWKECPSIFKVLKIKMTSNNNSKKHWFALKVFYNKVFAIEELLLKKTHSLLKGLTPPTFFCKMQ